MAQPLLIYSECKNNNERNHHMLRTALILLLASASLSLAQTDDILANAGSFKPRISVSDQYDERVSAIFEDGEIYRELVANPQNIAVTITANLAGADTGVIDGDTSVGVTAWHFDHSATLGEAPDYKPGGKRATFPLTKDVDLPNGDTATVRVGSVVYAWTAKLLTVTVVCTDIEAAGVGDVAASDYIGAAEANSSVAIDSDEIEVSVAFGDASGTRRVFIKGISKTTTRGFGSVANDTYEEFDITLVSLKGSADVSGPVVKAAFPAKPALDNTITVAGMAADIEAVELDSITVNGLPVAAASATIDDTDENGVWSWSVTGIPLKQGANLVAITFTDEDGNLSNVTRSYRLK